MPPRPAHARASDRHTAWLIASALAVVVLVLYGQTARFEFVSLDDLHDLVERPIVRNGLSRAGVEWALTTVEPNWHPVTWFSHMLDFTLFGANAGPQHLMNAAMHAANAVLLFVALRMMTGAVWPSALVAALFALHPMRVESVAWVTERKDVLSGIFWMLTLLAYTAYARTPSAARYAVVVAAFSLGLMSKTMLVTLPAVLLLLDVWPLARLRILGARDLPAAPAPSAATVLLEKVPLLAIALAASALTVFTLQSVEGVRSTEQVPLSWRLVMTPLAYVHYLADTLWPANLAVLYPHPALFADAQLSAYAWPAVGASALLVAITLACIATLRTRPYLAVGWFWFVGTLLPVIGLLQVGMQARADRFSYFPLIGVYIMVAWGLRDVLSARPTLRTPVTPAVAAALLAFTAASWAQIGTWRDSASLYRHAIAATENNFLAEAYLGAVLRGAGDTTAAERHLREALRIRPDEPFTRMQLGTLLQDSGRLDEAAEQHEAALRLDADYVQARGNLGVVRLRQGRPVDAERELRAAIALEPGYALAVTNLGAALLAQERWTEAATVLRQAVALSPNAPDAHNNLGVALVRTGDLRGAEAEFVTTLRLRPGHANASRSLEYVRSALRGGS